MIPDSLRDYRRAEVELRIRYGCGSWPNDTAELLFSDVIYPVCGPGFAQEHSDATAKFLPELTSCTLKGPNPIGPAGTRSCAAPGFPTGRFLAIGSASSPWLCKQPKLIRVLPWARTCWCENWSKRASCSGLPSSSWTPRGYHLRWNDNQSLSPGAERLREWLREISAEERIA